MQFGPPALVETDRMRPPEFSCFGNLIDDGVGLIGNLLTKLNRVSRKPWARAAAGRLDSTGAAD